MDLTRMGVDETYRPSSSPFQQISCSSHESASPKSTGTVSGSQLHDMLSKEDSPPNFSLTTLPMEIQLRVLHDCLVTDAPLINFGLPRDTVQFLVEGERRGQEEICLSIIFTCRTYHAEGWKILLEGNAFTYASATPVTPFIGPALKDSTWYIKIRRLAFRHDWSRSTQGLTLCISYIVIHARQLPLLETLDVDFVPLRAGLDGDVRTAMEFAKLYFKLVKKVMKSEKTTPQRQLRHVSITGLRFNWQVLLVSGLLSRMTSDCQIGMGYRRKGIRSLRTQRYSPSQTTRGIWIKEELATHWVSLEQFNAALLQMRSKPNGLRLPNLSVELYEGFNVVFEEWSRWTQVGKDVAC